MKRILAAAFVVALLVVSPFAAGAPLFAQGLPAVSPMIVGFDARWQPFLGCWRIVEDQQGGQVLPVAPGVMVCVQPSGTGAVSITTSLEGRTVLEQTITADGIARSIGQTDCSGMQLSEWSRDGERLFTRIDLQCAGQPRREIAGITLLAGGFWIDAQASTSGVQDLKLRRYQRTTAPAVRIAPRAGNQMSIEDVIEASPKVPAPALSAAIAASGTSFSLDSATLTRLADSGVSPDVIDVMVAQAYPDQFANSGSSSSQSSQSSQSSYQSSSGTSTTYTGTAYPATSARPCTRHIRCRSVPAAGEQVADGALDDEADHWAAALDARRCRSTTSRPPREPRKPWEPRKSREPRMPRAGRCRWRSTRRTPRRCCGPPRPRTAPASTTCCWPRWPGAVALDRPGPGLRRAGGPRPRGRPRRRRPLPYGGLVHHDATRSPSTCPPPGPASVDWRGAGQVGRRQLRAVPRQRLRLRGAAHLRHGRGTRAAGRRPAPGPRSCSTTSASGTPGPARPRTASSAPMHGSLRPGPRPAPTAVPHLLEVVGAVQDGRLGFTWYYRPAVTSESTVEWPRIRGRVRRIAEALPARMSGSAP